MTQTAAVLMADISGSTPLFERYGNESAANALRKQVAAMRETAERRGGHFISAKGDDVLCWFARADEAFDAAREMTRIHTERELDVHAGLQWGAFLERDGDIFGQCVNASARLCALAKPGEILIGEALHAELPPRHKGQVAEVSSLRLKGLEREMRLFAYLGGGMSEQTFVVDTASLRPDTRAGRVLLECADASWLLESGRSLTIGRATENDISLIVPSVSRHHATVKTINALVEFSDHSSVGSYLRAGGAEVKVFRRTVVLTGQGTIALGAPHNHPETPILRFLVPG